MRRLMIYKDTKSYSHCCVKSCRRSGSFGFTLIELLIVVAIMVVIVSVIGACLSAGIRVWDSVRVFNDLESDAFIAMDIMEKDIKNSLSVYAIGFDGKHSAVSFPTYITTDNGRSIGSVTYEYDESRRFLLRIERSWQEHDLREERLLENVDGVDFTYYNMSDSVWQNVDGAVTNFPDKVAVKLLLVNGEKEVAIERQILLPLQGRGQQ